MEEVAWGMEKEKREKEEGWFVGREDIVVERRKKIEGMRRRVYL